MIFQSCPVKVIIPYRAIFCVIGITYFGRDRMTKENIKAVLFDLDGTLTDTEKFYQKTLNNLYTGNKQGLQIQPMQVSTAGFYKSVFICKFFYGFSCVEFYNTSMAFIWIVNLDSIQTK